MNKVFSGLKQCFSNWRYTLLAALIAFFVLSFFLLLPNFSLIFSVAKQSLIQAIKLSLLLFGSIRTNFTSLGATTTVITAILFGINASLFAYIVRQRSLAKISGSEASASIIGTILGIFGIGCASCGSLVLSLLLPILGTSLTALPMHGQEFSLLGIILLLVALSITARKIASPSTCEVK